MRQVSALLDVPCICGSATAMAMVMVFVFLLPLTIDFCSNDNNCFLLSCKMWFPPSTFTSLAESVEQPSLFKKGSTDFHCFSEAFTTSGIFIPWRNRYLGIPKSAALCFCNGSAHENRIKKGSSTFAVAINIILPFMTRRIMLGDDPGTMVEAGGGDDGRKRPRIPTSSSQPKKAKRLSSLALRALAALEHDGGISCSDDERDAKDSRHRDISHFTSGALGVSELSGIENTAAHSAIDTVESVVAATERNAVLPSGGEAGRNSDDRAHELHHAEHKGSGEDAEERNNPKICQNSQSPDAGHVRNVHESNERSPDMPGAVETTFDDVPKDTSPVAGKKIIAEDEECVCPHVSTSYYGDVLSCFLSTPFHDKAMLSLHMSKEGTKTVGLQKEAKSRKEGDSVPILPQDIFIKSAKDKTVGSSTYAQGHTQHGINQGLSNVATTFNANISAQVNAFLMQECQKLIESSKQQQPNRDGLTRQPVSHEPETQRQLHLAQLNQQYTNQQQMISHLQAHNYFGSAQQQNSYFPMQMASQLHRVNQQMNGWHYPTPFAAPAPFFNPGVGMQNTAYNNLAFTSTSQQLPPAPHTKTPLIVHNISQPQPQTNASQPNPKIALATSAPQTNPKIALASMEIKLTDSNRDQIAKLPVAFGFDLDDGGTSYILAQAAAEKWYDMGKLAAMTTHVETKNGTNKAKDKDSALTGGDKSKGATIATPRNASVDGSTGAKKSKSPKSPAVLLETSNAPPDLPAGWTSKTFTRANSEKRASDKYFYTPQIGFKFRSMKACREFIEILKEPTIGGSERDALKEFKARGHKV